MQYSTTGQVIGDLLREEVGLLSAWGLAFLGERLSVKLITAVLCYSMS